MSLKFHSYGEIRSLLCVKGLHDKSVNHPDGRTDGNLIK